jgi:hypothetical protein
LADDGADDDDAGLTFTTSGMNGTAGRVAGGAVRVIAETSADADQGVASQLGAQNLAATTPAVAPAMIRADAAQVRLIGDRRGARRGEFGSEYCCSELSMARLLPSLSCAARDRAGQHLSPLFYRRGRRGG